MISIVIPVEPKLNDFGISENETPKIDSFVIKPIKKGKNREDKLYRYSIFVFYILAFFLIVSLQYQKNGWYTNEGDSILYVAMIGIIALSFTIFFPIVGIGLTSWLLDLIIPNSLIHDTKDEYDGLTLNMMDKKAKLEKYLSTLKKYTTEIDRMKKEYPMADSVFPIGMTEKDRLYPQLFRTYIQKVIKESFLPSFIDKIADADLIEANRASKDWWENLNPFDFEKEVGKWYQTKGYQIHVTTKSNDGGVDIILTKYGVTTYVQCKQWNDQVPVGVVRELYGVMASKGVKKGIVVCLKGGTKGAVDFANDNGIRIVTHHDFVKDTKPTKKVYTSKDIGTYWQYGNYYILYDAWKNVDDAINTINTTNYTSRNFVVGLYKWESFYLGIAIKKSINNNLSCFDYIVDAENGKIIFEKKRPVLSSSNIYRPYKKKSKRGRWYGRRW